MLDGPSGHRLGDLAKGHRHSALLHERTWRWHFLLWRFAWYVVRSSALWTVPYATFGNGIGVYAAKRRWVYQRAISHRTIGLSGASTASTYRCIPVE